MYSKEPKELKLRQYRLQQINFRFGVSSDCFGLFCSAIIIGHLPVMACIILVLKLLDFVIEYAGIP
jgi:hypothetical protein